VPIAVLRTSFNENRTARAQNVPTNFTRLWTGEVGLHYTNVKRSLGAVDDEKGITWALLYDVNQVNGQVIPQFLGNFDLGFPLPLKHSSIWLRSAAGIANGDPDSVVANFYFGGFGNNYIDARQSSGFVSTTLYPDSQSIRSAR
jgi:hypothetical protein